MKERLILCILLLSNGLFAQINESFNDGDFTINPVWVGDTAEFDVTSNELQSDGPASSSVLHLASSNSLIDSTEWIFTLRLGFNPSSTNFTRIYLVSDQADLENALNGYFIQVGEAAASSDSIDFFRQDTTTFTKLFTAPKGCASSSSNNTLNFRVTRKTGGIWEIYSDCDGNGNLGLDGGFTDNIYSNTNWFGIYCQYSTASRADKYFLDDILIQEIKGDTSKPKLSALDVINTSQIDLQFSEDLDQASAELSSNYLINNGIGNPATASRDAVDFSLVHLSLSTPITMGVNYSLNASGISDLNGNIMNPDSLSFNFYLANEGDIIINEIFADPSPAKNLPEEEFIELYNNTAIDIDLLNWTYTDASSSVALLPSYILKAGSHLILCSQGADTAFTAFGDVIGLSPWPTLNNSGDDLELRDNRAKLIDQVSYSSSWYKDALKDGGGWSLEQIDPASNCKSESNWIASIDTNGGTPGKLNSVFGSINDTSGPEIVGVQVLSTNSILISYSEAADSALAEDPLNYLIDNGIGNPASVMILGPDFLTAIVNFSSPLDSGTIYHISIFNITDCSGNIPSLPNSFTFAIPFPANRGDIIFNEIMAKPEPVVGLPAEEYLELYNRSDKAISLGSWKLSDRVDTIDLGDVILLPDSFLIITDDDNVSLFQSFGTVLGVGNMPNLNNAEDELTLVDDNNKLIDFIQYFDWWLRSDFKLDGGWSLELIDPNSPCATDENWTASIDSLGGTPGKINSVFGQFEDDTPPRLLRAGVIDNQTVRLFFNESLDSVSASNPLNYTVDNGLGNPINAVLEAPTFREVTLSFSNSMQRRIIYTIMVSAVSDCAGNGVGLDDQAQFGIPEIIDTGDVIINEILFNPYSGGFDFVELYNLSDKILDLSQISIFELSLEDGSVLEEGTFNESGLLFLPNTYVALTSNPDDILARYSTPNPNGVYQVEDMPNYADDIGLLVIADDSSEIIETVVYSNSWHFELLDDQNGVSLERINYGIGGQDENNWHSAASTVGFATPAYENSQFQLSAGSGSEVSVEPEVFSPDNDGFKDILNIHYNFDSPGFTANIDIFDDQGRLVKQLGRNLLLGTEEGVITWDGVTDNNKKAIIGIYIVYFEAYNLNGDIEKFKKTCVVAGRL